ncbi:hypothetical protein N4S67_22345 [Mycobacterium sp. CPCC 205710]|uniref:Aminoglycoside phosphotransferase domain-containing protein n=1 Tax=Mycobacterium deserti TaxID=2978347 RepID=A0ABT2MIC2_9MYCO|nr:hypothetical protein [Mycobacterium deserti]MCT7661150.1 hypothetical protein [Mycobacterium deserti]
MTVDWVRGGDTGLPIPAHIGALRQDPTTFLTNAFHAFGTLTPDNAVERVVRLGEVAGGSTGRKAVLTVEYTHPQPGLHTELFVKFSRDFDNAIRDVGRTQMEPEVRFAALARTPGFPIDVPATQFADYHRESGTGILISARIPFGVNGIERQYHKCLDYEMPEQVQHYRALITAVARLAGTQRSGRLPDHLVDLFPVDLQAATVGERRVLSPEQLDRRLTRLAEFVELHPGLFPAAVRCRQFLSRMAPEAVEVLGHEPAVWRHLAEADDYIALCHWNANVDNAWFWRDGDGELRCGLMDWGCVSRMNVAMALWGALSGAETDLWNDHVNDLLALFCDEVRRSGGPKLDAAVLARHLVLYATLMGVTWLLDVPALVRARVPGAGPSLARTDRGIRDDEAVRAPLQMLINVLNLWATRDLARALRGIG